MNIRLEAAESSGEFSGLGQLQETADPWAPGGKRLQAEEYNRTSKVLRMSRDKTLRKIKRLKSSHVYRRTEGGTKHLHRGRGDISPEKV